MLLCFMEVSLWSGLLGVGPSYFTREPLKRFIHLVEHHVELNSYKIKWDKHTNKWKLQWLSWSSPNSSGALHILASSLSPGSSPVLGKFFHFSVFPKNSARGTYNPQTFTVNSESRTVRLSGAVTVTSIFGNTRTKNEKKKTQHWHTVNLQTLLRWKQKRGYILLLVIEGMGSQNWGDNMNKNWPDLQRLTKVLLQYFEEKTELLKWILWCLNVLQSFGEEIWT